MLFLLRRKLNFAWNFPRVVKRQFWFNLENMFMRVFLKEVTISIILTKALRKALLHYLWAYLFLYISNTFWRTFFFIKEKKFLNISSCFAAVRGSSLSSRKTQKIYSFEIRCVMTLKHKKNAVTIWVLINFAYL